MQRLCSPHSGMIILFVFCYFCLFVSLELTYKGASVVNVIRRYLFWYGKIFVLMWELHTPIVDVRYIHRNNHCNRYTLAHQVHASRGGRGLKFEMAKRSKRWRNDAVLSSAYPFTGQRAE